MHVIKPGFFYWSVIVFLLVVQSTPASGQYDDPQNKGYRLYIYNIDISSPENQPIITLQCDIANTGRLPVRFEEPNLDSNLIHTKLRYEEGAWKDSLTVLQDAFFCALYEKKLNLDKGAYQKNITLSITPDTGINRIQCQASDQKKRKTATSEDIGHSNGEVSSGSCFDLILDSLTIRKKTKRKAWLTYSIQNRGTGPFETNADKKDLAIKLYLSGSDELTRGSIPMGGVYLDPPRQEEIHIDPGSSFRGELELDLRKKSRYLNYLILELDPFRNYEECNENNNVTALFLHD